MAKRIAVLILSAAAFVVIGVVAGRAQQQSARLPMGSQPPSRYQIVINQNARADTFLLDTDTGRIWAPTLMTGYVGDPTVWMPQDRVNSQVDLNAWAANQTLKPK